MFMNYLLTNTGFMVLNIPVLDFCYLIGDFLMILLAVYFAYFYFYFEGKVNIFGVAKLQ